MGDDCLPSDRDADLCPNQNTLQKTTNISEVQLTEGLATE